MALKKSSRWAKKSLRKCRYGMMIVNDQEKMSLWKFVAQDRVLSLGQSVYIYTQRI